MEWPSQRVPQGGIFQPAKVKYSPETKDFLKVLLNESKLTTMQRKQVDYCLRSGDPLPSLRNKSPTCLKNVPRIVTRPGTSKRRSHFTITNSGAYERERFVSRAPKLDRDKAKRHLQDRMAFGKDVAPTPRQPKTKSSNPKASEVEDINRFDQLVEEIKERENWLKEMEELGEGTKYKPIIEQQIQEKLREMKRLKSQENA